MQNQLDNKVYAGFFVRFIAFAIDSLIAALVVSTIKSPFSLAAASGLDFLNANFIFHYSFLDVLDYVGVVAYFVLLTYFTHTTPGKAAMRLEVVTVDKEWSLMNIIYRETIGRFFSSLLCAGYLAVGISKKKQGFHDMLCDTYVVYKGMVPQKKEEPATANLVEGTELKEKETVSAPEMHQVEKNNVVAPVEQSAASEEVADIPVPIYPEQPKTQEMVPPTYYTMPKE